MMELVSQAWNTLSAKWILSGMVFFFIGYTIAPWAYVKQIKILTAYPLWIAGKMEQWLEKKWPTAAFMVTIFFFNTVSLSIDLFSGLVPFLPVLLIIWTGLNIGIIAYHTLKGRFYFTSLINPVALLELPAAFITFSFALQYNLHLVNFAQAPDLPFQRYVYFFAVLVLPLLFLAAILEASIIRYTKPDSDNFEGRN